MAFDIRQIDLGKLNSMTKYPSILTYHNLGDKGILQETVQIPFQGRVIGTEKVDGTNTRMIFCPDQSVVVGSREDLLWERRDLIGNPAMGIVEAVKETVHSLFEKLCRPTRSPSTSSRFWSQHRRWCEELHEGARSASACSMSLSSKTSRKCSAGLPRKLQDGGIAADKHTWMLTGSSHCERRRLRIVRRLVDLDASN